FGSASCHGEVVDDRFHVLEGDIFGTPTRTGQSLPMDDVILGTPIDGVRFVNVMGGFNEPGTTRAADRLPWWLPKATNYPTADGGEIQVPSVLTGPVNMESELAVVVGKPLRKASPEEAHDAILGWTVFNDITAWEYGAFGAVGLWALGKSVDGFTSW